MSLRAVPAKLYLIRCDTCGLETAGSTMPVAAELRAAEGGWRTEKNPLRHVCPWCVTKMPAALVPAPHDPMTAGR